MGDAMPTLNHTAHNSELAKTLAAEDIRHEHLALAQIEGTKNVVPVLEQQNEIGNPTDGSADPRMGE